MLTRDGKDQTITWADTGFDPEVAAAITAKMKNRKEITLHEAVMMAKSGTFLLVADALGDVENNEVQHFLAGSTRAARETLRELRDKYSVPKGVDCTALHISDEENTAYLEW